MKRIKLNLTATLKTKKTKKNPDGIKQEKISLKGATLKNKRQLDATLNRIYKANSERIDKYIKRPAGSPKTQQSVFKSYIKSRMEEGMSLRSALKKFEESRMFTSTEEGGKMNIMSAIKNEGLLDQFRRYRGWNNKFNYDDLEYIGVEDKITTYDYKVRDKAGNIIKIVHIHKDKSPEEELGTTIWFTEEDYNEET